MAASATGGGYVVCGNAPAVSYFAGCYGVFALEELLRLLGTPVCESLLPANKQTSSPDAAT
jgi:hypothetical protein